MIRRLLALALLAPASGLACCQTSEDLSHNVKFRAGFAGSGVAVEAYGPDGCGLGLSLTLYPVTDRFSKLQRTW